MKPLHVDEDRAKNLKVLASIDAGALVEIADELETIEGAPRHSEERLINTFGFAEMAI